MTIRNFSTSQVRRSRQVLSEIRVWSKDPDGTVHDHGHVGDLINSKGVRETAHEAFGKLYKWIKSRFPNRTIHADGLFDDVHEATEAPEYYEHIDDIDHERIVKHAEDVIKRIDYILKIYDKHEHKLDNKQFKQVRKHKNQLNKIKTMITSELERHKKQALDEDIVDKSLLGLSGLTGGMALGAAAGGTIGALANSFGLPIDFEKAAYLGATVGGAYGPIHVSKIDTDAEASEAIWKYGEAIRNGKSKEVLDDLYNKQLRAANIHNSLVLFNSSKRRPYTKLHEETLLPNILKPSRNTDASGYARYISEQNSSSNLRSKPINEGVIDEAKFIKSTEHDYEPFNDKNAYRITDILKSKKFKHESSKGNSHIYVHVNGSKVLITKSGSGAITGLTHIDSNGKRTLFARKAEGVGQTEIDVKRFQKHLSSLNEGLLDRVAQTFAGSIAGGTAGSIGGFLGGAALEPLVPGAKEIGAVGGSVVGAVLGGRAGAQTAIEDEMHAKNYEIENKKFMDDNPVGKYVTLQNGVKVKIVEHQPYGHFIGQHGQLTKKFHRYDVEGIDDSSLNEGYKYTEVKPQGYEEHKAKILNFLSQYGKASIADIGGLAGPDDLELHKHYEPGFIGRTLGWQKTEPQKIASSYTTFILKHPTDPNQHMEVSYTVGGEEYSRAGWRLSVKTPHLMKFAHIIKGHPNRGSENEVYVSEGKSPYATNTDGINESLPHLKKYINNHFLTNKPIVNVR